MKQTDPGQTPSLPMPWPGTSQPPTMNHKFQLVRITQAQKWLCFCQRNTNGLRQWHRCVNALWPLISEPNETAHTRQGHPQPATAELLLTCQRPITQKGSGSKDVSLEPPGILKSLCFFSNVNRDYGSAFQAHLFTSAPPRALLEVISGLAWGCSHGFQTRISSVFISSVP